MNRNWIRGLGVALPILGVFITIWDAINQSKVAELDKQEFEAELVAKYGLEEVQNTEN